SSLTTLFRSHDVEAAALESARGVGGRARFEIIEGTQAAASEQPERLLRRLFGDELVIPAREEGRARRERGAKIVRRTFFERGEAAPVVVAEEGRRAVRPGDVHQ